MVPNLLNRLIRNQNENIDAIHEESCEQLPECSKKQEGQNKKKNGGSDKELQTRGMKRKGIEDKGHRCLILDSFQLHIVL